MFRIDSKFITVVILLLISALSYAQPPVINIIYPQRDSLIGAVDSTFIFGSVTPGSKMTINGFEIKVHKEGGFLGFLAVEPGPFEYEIVAWNKTDTTRMIWRILVPEPVKSFPGQSLRIADKMTSLGNLSLAMGDKLVVEIQGAPGCVAYFSVPGYADSVPMVELEPKIQPYWGQSVFGAGTVPDSLMIRGFYRGYVDIDSRKLPDSTRIIYHLMNKQMSEILQRIFELTRTEIDLTKSDSPYLKEIYRTDSSRIYVKINSSEFPNVISFTDSTQIVRVGPRRGYYATFQPAGIKALAVGAEGDWLKLKLSQNQTGWVNRKSVEFLDKNLPITNSYLRAIRTNAYEDRTIIELPLSNKHPFRIEEAGTNLLSLYLYGVISDTDWIRYDTKDSDIDLITWSQVELDLYKLTVQFKKPIWGYDVYYENNILKLQLNKPPDDLNNLRGKVIVVDPGHWPDRGATGCTGLAEREANLAIAMQLKKQLQNRGALVVMTHEGDMGASLYGRPEIAKAVEADLFVSIHNNALPDGVNPFENNGTSAYYYHPHSKALAELIHSEIVDRVEIRSHGLYYGNLAVIRPTQFPAVLIECAFMMIPEQEAMLLSTKHQKKFAKAIRIGIEKFLRENQ
ncbi:MAG: N-acetylmuramoyl-L-alanine amidase [Candidatus Zixiibacteriota bacterium]